MLLNYTWLNLRMLSSTQRYIQKDGRRKVCSITHVSQLAMVQLDMFDCMSLTYPSCRLRRQWFHPIQTWIDSGHKVKAEPHSFAMQVLKIAKYELFCY